MGSVLQPATAKREQAGGGRILITGGAQAEP